MGRYWDVVLAGISILVQFVTLSVGDLWAAVKGKYPLADDLWGYEGHDNQCLTPSRRKEGHEKDHVPLAGGPP